MSTNERVRLGSLSVMASPRPRPAASSKPEALALKGRFGKQQLAAPGPLSVEQGVALRPLVKAQNCHYGTPRLITASLASTNISGRLF